MKPRHLAAALVAFALFAAAAAASAQAPAFGPELPPLLRRAADLIPGDAPTAVRVVSLLPGRGPLSAMVEGASPRDSVLVGYPVYQATRSSSSMFSRRRRRGRHRP
jgi:hypothetical protein